VSKIKICFILINIYLKQKRLDFSSLLVYSTVDKIKDLTKEFPKDMDLSREVRKLLSEMKSIQKKALIEITNWDSDDLDCNY
jgi:hypothetical protein